MAAVVENLAAAVFRGSRLKAKVSLSNWIMKVEKHIEKYTEEQIYL